MKQARFLLSAIIVAVILFAAVRTVWAQDGTRGPLGEIGPPVCTDSPPGSSCYELVVSGKTESSKFFSILEIGPGGRICGPAVVRVDKDTTALTLSKGVCIPAEEK